jgi:YbgC/YbaW family acyl-CoA thioester hydrolase
VPRDRETEIIMNAATTTTHHRVLMTNVDLVQVNYTRMFVWMDHGFTQLLHDLEHPASTLLRQRRSTPVVDAHCNYLRPVTLDDEFNLVSQVIEVGRSSFVVGHDFVDATGLFARGECRHVWIRTHPQHTAVRVPDWLQRALMPRETAPIGDGKPVSTDRNSSMSARHLSLSPNVAGSEYP